MDGVEPKLLLNSSHVLSHPEIFGFQDVIKIKNKTTIFFVILKIYPTLIFFTGNLV